MRGWSSRRGLGQSIFQEIAGLLDPASSLVQIQQSLSQYSSDQIMQAFQALQDAFASESAELSQETQWGAQNAQTLTPDGQQLYIQGLNSKTQVVNQLQDAVSQFASVLTNLGYSVNAPQGLTGWRRSALMGALPVAAVLITIIVIVIGAVAWAAIQNSRAQAEAQLQQAKAMTQAQANIPALVAAGWTPQQIQDYLAQQQNANKPNLLDQIPWKTLAVAGVAVIGIKAVFG